MKENKTTTLKLSGYKYGAWILPAMLGFLVIYFSLTYQLEIKLIYLVLIPVILLLYPMYFITFGKNRYLILTE